MPGKHVVITVMGSLGDLHPMLALGCALQRRGHHVTVASARVYQERIEKAGLTFYRLRPEIDIDNQAIYRYVFDMKWGPQRLFRNYVLPTLHETCTDLTPLLESADFLINATLILPGPILARKLNLPWASVTLQPFPYFSITDPSVLPFSPWLENATRWGPAFWRLMSATMRWGSSWWLKNFHLLRKNLAVPDYGHPLFEGQYSPYLNLALFSPHFARPQADWPLHTIATGFPFMDVLSHSIQDLPEPLQRFLEAGSPPIVFTLGSSAVRIADDFYNTAIRAMKRLNQGKSEPYRAIFLIGDNILDEDLTGEMLVWDYVPYGQLFLHAACIVHQGGIGTTAQGMRAGKPMVIVPYGFDQPDNAARAQRLGIGVMLRKNKLNEKTLAQALQEVLTHPRYEEKANALSLKIQSENCFEIVYDTIQAIL